MRDRRVPVGLGDALDQCLRDAKTAWINENQAGRDREYAWSTDVVTTHLDAQLSHGGRANVQITIVCKQPWKSEVAFFKLARRGPDAWIRREGSLNLT